MTESLVLASLGGLLGVAIGAAMLEAAPALIPPGLLPNAVTLSFDGRLLVFCAATAILRMAAMSFGICSPGVSAMPSVPRPPALLTGTDV